MTEKDPLTQGIEFIDPWLTRRYEGLDWPGFAVAISHNGMVRYSSARGHANLDSNRVLNANGIFQVASETKTFTTAAAMLLAERGKFSLNDQVTTFITELRKCGDERWDSVTIEHLLSNGSGLSRDGHSADYWELDRPFPDEDELIDIAKTSIVYDPGTKMKYSNLGFSLAGIVLERASDRSFNEIIEAEIVQPLGLFDTTLSFPLTRAERLITGYGRCAANGRQALPHPPTNAYTPATGMYSTLSDLNRFFGNLIPDAADTLFSDEIKRQMSKPRWEVEHSPNVRYALGLDIGTVSGREVIGHGGGYPGYLCKTLIDAERGLVVSGMTNCIDGDALMMTIGVMQAIDFFFSNSESGTYDSRRFNCFLSGLWRDKQIVAANSEIAMINPHSWSPFSDAEVLTYIDDYTLRIASANGYQMEGELVKYYRNSVQYAGTTLKRDHTGI